MGLCELSQAGEKNKTKFNFRLDLKIDSLYTWTMSKTDADLQDIQKMLVAHGVRPTIHRIHIAHFVLHEANHPTAEDVLAWANQNLHKVSRATVYNTLRELTQAGLIREFKFPQISKTVYDKKTENHYHFFDRGSESFVDLDLETVKVDIQLPTSYEIDSVDILISGNRSS